MKHAVRVLIWLYPSSWRKRYGSEFEALLEDATPSLSDAFDIVWGALKMRITRSLSTKIIGAGLAVTVLVATLVFVTAPKRYRSEAFFNARPSGQFTAHVVEALKGNVFFNREFLSSLILKRNLYPRERSRMPLDAVIDEMKQNIRVYYSPTVSAGSEDKLKFVVAFEYSDARVAQEVNEELVSQFLGAIVDSALVDSPPPPIPTNFQILDPATLPLKPVAPSLARSSAIGLFGGLLSSLALAILAKLHRPPSTFANG